MKKLFLSSLAINLLVIFINLLTGILSARFLGAYGRGELATATRWTELFIMIFTFGLPGALTYLGKKFKDEQSSFLGTYLMLNAIIAPIGLFIGYIIFPYLFISQTPDILQLARISLLSLPFGIIIYGLIGSLQGLNKFNQVMLIRIMTPVGILVTILTLLLFDMYNVRNFVIVNTLLSMVICLLALILVVSYIKPRINNFKLKSAELVKKGVEIYGYSLTQNFGNLFDQLLISLFLSPYLLGLYTVAISIRNMLVSVLNGAINVYLMSSLMDMEIGKRRQKVERIHGILFYTTVGITISVILIMPILIPLIYGKEFSNAILMGIILLVSVPFAIGNGVITSLLSSIGKFKSITISEISSIIIGLIITISLLRTLGAEAAALGVSLSTIAKWFYNVAVSKKVGIRIPNLFYLYKDSFVSLIKYVINLKILRRKSK